MKTKVVRLLPLFLWLLSMSLAGGVGADTPAWSVYPADFEQSGTVTAMLYLNNAVVEGADNLVGAFVGGACRGTASPMHVQALGTWLVFLTVYAKTTGETMRFKVYLAGRDAILDAEETILFQTNGINGTPVAPFALHVSFAYDVPPRASGIPDQSVEAGASFAPVQLDAHLQEVNGDAVRWEYGANRYVQVSIDSGHVATIVPPSAVWTGRDSVIFTAVDRTQQGLAGSDTAVYTVRPAEQVVTVSLALRSGYNLVALPVRPRGLLWSSTWLPAIGQGAKVVRWLKQTKQYESAFDVRGGTVLGAEFPIELGEAYFVSVRAETTLTISGTPVERPVAVALTSGLNLIAVPDTVSRLTASTMLRSLPGSVVTLTRWNRTRQQYESAFRLGLGGDPVIPAEIGDFALERGEGYFVSVEADAVWDPGGEGLESIVR